MKRVAVAAALFMLVYLDYGNSKDIFASIQPVCKFTMMSNYKILLNVTCILATVLFRMMLLDRLAGSNVHDAIKSFSALLATPYQVGNQNVIELLAELQL